MHIPEEQFVWERHYISDPKGFRSYPNEELVRFFGKFFLNKLSLKERGKVKVLEVGCGNGANLWFLAKEGFDVTGFDFSPTAVQQAQKTLKKWNVHAKIECADMLSYVQKKETFDVIIDVGALQCLSYSDLKRAYSTIFSLLKKGGSFFSYHMGTRSWDYQQYKKFKWRYIEKHTIFFGAHPQAIFPNIGLTCVLSPSLAKTMLIEGGFSVLSIESIFKTYESRTKKIEYLSIIAKKPL